MTLCNKIFHCTLLNNEIFTPNTSSTNIFGIVWSLTNNIRKFTYKFTYKYPSRFHRDKFKPKIYWQFTMSQNIGMIYKIKDNGFFKHLTSKLTPKWKRLLPLAQECTLSDYFAWVATDSLKISYSISYFLTADNPERFLLTDFFTVHTRLLKS